jgi:HlyD family secretion protein
VGTQVSNVVTNLYADFNSLVKKGQVIARIDPTIWETQLKDAQASLSRAQASFENAKLDFSRNKRLFDQNLISQSELDAKELSLKTATGNLASAKEGVAKAKINLGYCTITAPVDGLVVSRVVDEGQTVAASYSTPNLFTIAQDLSKMKVQAAIDEADIGQVQVGQNAFFTVDSYPDRQFQGQVTEVQLNPVTTNNVVTYNVIMQVTNEPRVASTEAPAAPNMGAKPGPGAWSHHRAEGGAPFQGSHGPKAAPVLSTKGGAATIETATARYIPAGAAIYKGDFALFPGMTANVTIVTNRRDNVLRVPNAALRFNPAAFTGPKKPVTMGFAPARATQASGNKGGMVQHRDDKIWVLENGKPKAVPVKIGATDGQFTEISGEGLSENMDILIGVEDLKKGAAAAGPMLGGPGGPPRR